MFVSLNDNNKQYGSFIGALHFFTKYIILIDNKFFLFLDVKFYNIILYINRKEWIKNRYEKNIALWVFFCESGNYFFFFY